MIEDIEPIDLLSANSQAGLFGPSLPNPKGFEDALARQGAGASAWNSGLLHALYDSPAEPASSLLIRVADAAPNTMLKPVAAEESSKGAGRTQTDADPVEAAKTRAENFDAAFKALAAEGSSPSAESLKAAREAALNLTQSAIKSNRPEDIAQARNGVGQKEFDRQLKSVGLDPYYVNTSERILAAAKAGDTKALDAIKVEVNGKLQDGDRRYVNLNRSLSPLWYAADAAQQKFMPASVSQRWAEGAAVPAGTLPSNAEMASLMPGILVDRLVTGTAEALGNFMALGHGPEVTADGTVRVGTFADGSTKYQYRNPLTGQCFWANPTDPHDAASMQAASGVAALAVTGRPLGSAASAGIREGLGSVETKVLDSSGLPKDWKLTIAAKGTTGPLDAKVEAGVKGAGQPVKDPIGHATVIIEGPKGEKAVAGKWPVSEDETVYDWNKERDGFFAPFGMRGAIRHDEDAYLNKYSEHYRFKTYKIDAQQAKRALDYIDQQKAAAQARELRYKLMNDQCASFACEVTRQAGQKPPYAGTIIESPRTLYNSIGKDRE